MFRDQKFGDLESFFKTLSIVWLFIWSVFSKLDDEFCEFLKRNFPDFNERMVTVPVSFQYKDVQGVKTHGIVKDDRGRQEGEKSQEEKKWNNKE